ncbi:preprotein translocase subunit YajC [uncultured Maricaulis sp.]|uniref:preprotein translocase subunit YajC n=1 Tax=uncultured Maricaulis sp. TaxID=174710 RepID=UPI00260A39E4|nr:preprotein translocase subunit YajC [uncultured Maricaulis sp.]
MEQFLSSPIPMLVLMGLVFYFLLIRPQQKRMKEHKALIEGLKRGDEVITQGGMIGKISKVADEEVTLDVGEGVKVRIVRSTIADVKGRPAPKPANDAKKDDKKDDKEIG